MLNVKFNIAPIGYNQLPQRNTIQWRIMYKNGDVYEDQTWWFLCKDFFNDVVGAFHGYKFTIYSFNNQNLKFNEDGLYVAVKDINQFEVFKQNIETIINPKLKEEVNGTVDIIGECQEKGDTVYILRLPLASLANTFCMSLLSLAIRGCNYGVAYKDWDDLFSDTNPLKNEGYSKSHKRLVHSFLPPPEKRGFVFMNGHTDKTPPIISYIAGTIHNAGIIAWQSTTVPRIA